MFIGSCCSNTFLSHTGTPLRHLSDANCEWKIEENRYIIYLDIYPKKIY